jgi:hypothetical protein
MKPEDMFFGVVTEAQVDEVNRFFEPPSGAEVSRLFFTTSEPWLSRKREDSGHELVQERT